MVVGLLTVGTAAIATASSAQGSTPALTAAQKQKLASIQAQFVPGAKDRNWDMGFDGVAKYCGAAIPMTIDPSTVAVEKMDGDRTGIPSVCRELAESVIYTCDNADDADPVVKEMVRGSVKRMVCAATSNEADVGDAGQKFTLDAQGTLTMTYGPRPSNTGERGRAFLDTNVKKNGLSIAGQKTKRKMIAQLKTGSFPKSLTDECGMSPTVTVDDKLAEHYSKHPTHSAIGACVAAMQSIYNFCGSGGVFARPDLKAFAQKNIKSVACNYGETNSLSLKNGVLSVATNDAAPTPNFNNRMMFSLGEYDMEWMKANFNASTASTASTSSSPASSSSTPSSPTRVRRARR
jgi:hypothetical protein